VAFLLEKIQKNCLANVFWKMANGFGEWQTGI
jgi:hypothetical protein